jgi:GDPmannose 4,6-dehydratase
MKTALITGITGQDGSYLAEFLLEKGYKVFGLVRRLSIPNLGNIEHFIDKVTLIEGDLHDQASLNRAVKESQPDEVYNLAAQSFVATSWKQPLLTSEITGLGTLRMLEAVKEFAPQARFYQASSSEMYGNATENVQDEQTKFRPRSPYAISKLYSHWISRNFRESYGMYVCCGILFNHESPRRGIEFVTRKITDAVARIKLGLANELSLGSLDSKRDWGFAGDYVEAMWLMLQQEEPEDFVISTGITHSVQDFVIESFKSVGIENWRDYVKQDPCFMRPAELFTLQGQSAKAKDKMGWEPKVNFSELVKMMVDADIKRIGGRSEDTEVTKVYEKYETSEGEGHKLENKQTCEVYSEDALNSVNKVGTENATGSEAYSKAYSKAQSETQKKKVLITGISGFVGKHLKKYLENQGLEVFGFDRSSENVGEGIYRADLLDKESLKRIFEKVRPEQVYHLAAQSSVKESFDNPQATLDVNVNGTENLLEVVCELGLENKCRILVVTSADIYGIVGTDPIKEDHPLNPVSPYGKSRLAQEKLIQQYTQNKGMSIVIVRSFPHTGPGQTDQFVCSSFAKQMALIEAGKQNPVMKVGNLDAARDFMDVRDVVRAYFEIVNNTYELGCYNLSSGKAYKISEMLNLLLQMSSKEVMVERDPDRMRPSDIPILLGDHSRFSEITGWQPQIPITQTIKDLFDYWRERV